MENTPNTEKLPDLVSNLEQQETFNAITDTHMSTSPASDSALTTNAENGEFNGITKTTFLDTVTPVTPENAGMLPETVLDTNDTVTPVPVGHDTTTTTDEEEAAKALLALCNLPDMGDDEDAPDDNATLMPVGGLSMSIDVNPVQVKLGADDLNQVIEQLPHESQFEALTDTSQSGAKGQIAVNNPQTSV